MNGEFAKRLAIMFASSMAYGFTFTAGALAARKLAEKCGLVEDDSSAKTTRRPTEDQEEL